MKKKPKKPKDMTDRDLQLILIHIDKTYFDEKLPDMLRIKFVKNLYNRGEWCDGTFDPSTMLISIDNNLRFHPNLCHIVVLHECAHVALPNYKGDGLITKDHGMLFQAKLVELFNQGAYDEVL